MSSDQLLGEREVPLHLCPFAKMLGKMGEKKFVRFFYVRHFSLNFSGNGRLAALTVVTYPVKTTFFFSTLILV